MNSLQIEMHKAEDSIVVGMIPLVWIKVGGSVATRVSWRQQSFDNSNWRAAS
jgi:hypothetical protein